MCEQAELVSWSNADDSYLTHLKQDNASTQADANRIIREAIWVNDFDKINEKSLITILEKQITENRERNACWN